MSLSYPPARHAKQIDVLGLACALSMITYLDRVCFGAAVPFILKDLGLKDVSDLKWAFTAFTIAYAAFEIPSGWLGDKFGPKKTLLRIVFGWSVFTALTGLVGLRVGGFVLGSLGTLCLVRFLFGACEAGAYPNLARVVANWFAAHHRGRAKGWIWMSGRFMGGVTPLIWTLLVVGSSYTSPLVNWRVAFVLFGLIGIVWCLVFMLRFRDVPSSIESQAAKTSLVSPAFVFPWRAIFRDRNLWLLGAMYACASFSWYFNITYFPSFLETRHGIDPKSIWGAILKGGPLLLGGVGCLVGGYWTDHLVRSSIGRRWGRRIPAMVGHALCGLCYLVTIYAPSPWTSALAISLAAFSNDLMMGPAWSTCQDIGHRYTAIVAGWMNTCGNLGGALSGWALGTILEYSINSKLTGALVDSASKANMDPAVKQAALTAGYDICLFSFVGVSFIAMLLWLPINPERKFGGDSL